MVKVRTGVASLAAVFLLIAGAAESQAQNLCAAGKLKSAGKRAGKGLNCYSKAAKAGTAVDPLCLSALDAKMTLGFQKAEDKGDCTVTGNEMTVKMIIDNGVNQIVTALPSGTPGEICAAAKLKAAGKKIFKKLVCYSKAEKAGTLVDPTCISAVELKYLDAFAKAETGTCNTTGDAAAIEAIVDSTIDLILDELAVSSVPATPTPTPIPPTPFRATSLTVRDPHLFFFDGAMCNDITDPPGFLGLSVNQLIADAINGDSEPDGSRDLNVLALFRPLVYPPTASTTVDVGASATCDHAGGGNPCTITDPMGFQTLTYNTQAMGTCHSPQAGTTGPGNVGNYTPAVENTTGPCVVSDPLPTFAFDFDGVTISLNDAIVAGRLIGNPAMNIDQGLISGFLPKSVADMIPIPQLGGAPLSSLLPGGGSCGTPADLDVGPPPDNAPGWYFYINFGAQLVNLN